MFFLEGILYLETNYVPFDSNNTTFTDYSLIIQPYKNNFLTIQPFNNSSKMQLLYSIYF